MAGQKAYSSETLVAFAERLLVKAGLEQEKAEVVSRVLVEADLMGHTTHGLNLLSSYLRELQSGGMKREGLPELVTDHGSSVVWDGGYLPGTWLTWRAIEEASSRMKEYPVVTFVIRRSHHIACLAAYMPRITERGYFGILATSDPAVGLVAPYGGRVPLFTPNPVAMGIPAGEDGPIIIDVSTSVTAAGVVNRHKAAGTKLPGQWLLDAGGEPTDDPNALAANPPGSILPLGGLDAGYKGYALGLFIEALTSALGGHGRADHPSGWGASVFLQLIDPDAFGGKEAFERETGWLTAACRENPPRPGVDRVRVPGDRALELKRTQLAEGVRLADGIMSALEPWAETFGVAVP